MGLILLQDGTLGCLGSFHQVQHVMQHMVVDCLRCCYWYAGWVAGSLVVKQDLFNETLLCLFNLETKTIPILSNNDFKG